MNISLCNITFRQDLRQNEAKQLRIIKRYQDEPHTSQCTGNGHVHQVWIAMKIKRLGQDSFVGKRTRRNVWRHHVAGDGDVFMLHARRLVLWLVLYSVIDNTLSTAKHAVQSHEGYCLLKSKRGSALTLTVRDRLQTIGCFQTFVFKQCLIYM